ncbi:MAG TPA: ACP phosphodiesterase [Rhodanobacteraceae bacterium]|jgi:acyl carrier protein phosphodiesterase|nr:ACP phosphodiesterase [Rhodanobacteraceae bacterium]
MNLLAHALLAAPDSGLMLGSAIGDFVRGAIDPALPERVRAGIALHRSVDAFTDAHREISAARELFDPPFRRYAGILIDVWFDHLLARQWAEHGEGELDAFSLRVRAMLSGDATIVPERMRGFIAYLEAHDLPAAYRETSAIGDALRGMSRRLSRANPLDDALPVLVARRASLQQRFDAFFPDLRAFAEARGAELLRDADKRNDIP